MGIEDDPVLFVVVDGNGNEKERSSEEAELPVKTTTQANKRDSVPLAGRLSFL